MEARGVHDPFSGEVVSVLDVTGGDVVATPAVDGLIRAAVHAVEAELRLQAMTAGPKRLVNARRGARGRRTPPRGARRRPRRAARRRRAPRDVAAPPEIPDCSALRAFGRALPRSSSRSSCTPTTAAGDRARGDVAAALGDRCAPRRVPGRLPHGPHDRRVGGRRGGRRAATSAPALTVAYRGPVLLHLECRRRIGPGAACTTGCAATLTPGAAAVLSWADETAGPGRSPRSGRPRCVCSARLRRAQPRCGSTSPPSTPSSAPRP